MRTGLQARGRAPTTKVKTSGSKRLSLDNSDSMTSKRLSLDNSD